MNLAREFHSGVEQLERIIYSQVVLIPKKEEAIQIRDFRPVSLLNTSFKIISKVLENRLDAYVARALISWSHVVSESVYF